jgi:hypothetical protein
MKKSKIFAAVILLAMFSSLFTVVNVGQLGITSVTGEAPVEDVTPIFTPNVQYLGANETYIQLVSGMTQDGDLSDWAAYDHDVFNGVDLYLGYDATHVWVAAQWADTTYDWNTTNFVNKTDTNAWEILDGADDMLAIGFSDDTDQDVWVWTASNRTDDGYAYECNATWYADGGTLPHVMNWNGTHPEYDAYGSAILDYSVIPVNTQYSMWFADPTVTGSQNDVIVDYDWNKTKEGYYTLEMSRLLDTGEADDMVLDFTGDLSDLLVWVGTENQQDCHNMEVGITDYTLWDNNDPAYLQFSVTQAVWDEVCVISGNASDDYAGLDLQVSLDGGTTYDSVGIDPLTGEWIYFFGYNPTDMPIGEQTITVTLVPKYDAPIVLEQDTEFVDTEAPTIVGIVDIGANYADQGGVPNDTAEVEIIIGVDDNYDPTENLLCELYYFKDDDVILMIPMTQFSVGGPTYSATLPLVYEAGEPNNYTYFVSVWDGEMNKIDTDRYEFQVIYIPPPVVTPGFGILIGLFGLAGAAFILYKKFKK